jgi:predicted glycosyltransferase
MKIWIDFINTPQVTFFAPLLADFRKNNHEILLTCRDSGNTVALLKQRDLPYTIVGKKVGKGAVQKLLFFPKRLVILYFFIKKNRPDIAASQSSFYQPVVAGILGIPCLYTNDNEHAKGNLFGFLFAKKVVLPVALQNERFVNRWPLRSKVLFYPSVKEAIYLSQRSDISSVVSGEKSKIYFRPEPWSAQYYNGPLNFFDTTLLELSKETEVVVLPRDTNQTDHYSQEKFSTLKVARKPLSFDDIISDCKLFIGAGGSMTREMAVMEIPVISIYQSELLAVDKYLIEKGLMIINPDVTYDEIKSFMGALSGSKNDGSVLNEGKQSYLLMKKLIYNLQHE